MTFCESKDDPVAKYANVGLAAAHSFWAVAFVHLATPWSMLAWNPLRQMCSQRGPGPGLQLPHMQTCRMESDSQMHHRYSTQGPRVTHERQALQQNVTVEFSPPLSVLQHQLNDDVEKDPVDGAQAGLRARLASMSLIEQGELRPDGHWSHNTHSASLTKHTQLTHADEKEAWIPSHLGIHTNQLKRGQFSDFLSMDQHQKRCLNRKRQPTKHTDDSWRTPSMRSTVREGHGRCTPNLKSEYDGWDKISAVTVAVTWAGMKFLWEWASFCLWQPTRRPCSCTTVGQNFQLFSWALTRAGNGRPSQNYQVTQVICEHKRLHLFSTKL